MPSASMYSYLLLLGDAFCLAGFDVEAVDLAVNLERELAQAASAGRRDLDHHVSATDDARARVGEPQIEVRRRARNEHLGADREVLQSERRLRPRWSRRARRGSRSS